MGLLLLGWHVPLRGESPAGPAVRVESVEAGRLVHVSFPGSLIDVAELCHDGRCFGLLLLTRATGGGRSLLLLEPGAEPSLTTVTAELPRRADALALVDVDADATPDVLLGEPGRLYSLGRIGERLELGAPRLLAETRDLNLAGLEDGGFLGPGRLVVPALRNLEIHEPDAGGWRLAERHELPHRAELEATGLRLYTYPVTRLTVDGRTLYAAGPEAHGNRRLRTVLIEPGAEETETEAWSWLPEPETVANSWYTSLNGRPALVVTTVRADRVGLFEKKKLRVFSLRPGDRSRAGSSPLLAVRTASLQWQSTDPNFHDVDGDGYVDLVLIQPEGLGGKKLVVEAYLGRSRAQFHPLTLRSVVQARHPDDWRYGADVDGDGVADLVTRSNEVVQLFAGLADPKKKQVLNKKPLWELDLGAGIVEAEPDEEGDEDDDSEDDVPDWEGSYRRGRMTVRDVDGDGRAEILVPSQDAGILRIIDPR